MGKKCWKYPWSVEEFLDENKDNEFISCISEDILDSMGFISYRNKMYSRIMQLFPKDCTSSNKWVSIYTKLNTFLLSEIHLNMCTHLFEVDKLSKIQNKFSTKFAFFLLNKEIAKKQMK